MCTHNAIDYLCQAEIICTQNSDFFTKYSRMCIVTVAIRSRGVPLSPRVIELQFRRKNLNGF